MPVQLIRILYHISETGLLSESQPCTFVDKVQLDHIIITTIMLYVMINYILITVNYGKWISEYFV